MFKHCLLTFCFGCFLFLHSGAQQGKTAVDLSNYPWKLWLDTSATWVNDTLYAPPVALNRVRPNLPSGGWNALEKVPGKMVRLPATVEQYYWGRNGNPFGVAGNYLGVSWWTTKFSIPSASKGRHIVLQFDAVRFRAEIFINRQLAGYDLVNSTPFEVDITDFVHYGSNNEIAVRITDPNGNFDWRDSQNFMWGNYRTNPTHGFGGITGKLKLVTTDKVYTSDVFIKNRPVPNEIEVQVTTSNLTTGHVDGSLLLSIKEAKASGKTVFQQAYTLTNLRPGDAVNSFRIAVKDAKLWSIDSPNLYLLTAEWKGNNHTVDSYTQRFGFRWFEVKDVAGDKQFYLNGKRMVLLTAISWGFWPVNGIAPSDALAKKQIGDAKQLGYWILPMKQGCYTLRNLVVTNIRLTVLIQQTPWGKCRRIFISPPAMKNYSA